jgi:hypothetical protein
MAKTPKEVTPLAGSRWFVRQTRAGLTVSEGDPDRSVRWDDSGSQIKWFGPYADRSTAESKLANILARTPKGMATAAGL